MAGLALLKRFISTMTLVNGQSAYLDLPRDFLYAGLLLRLRGTLTVAGGTTNGTLHDENPMSYLTRIIVEGSGGGAAIQLKNYRGVHAFRAQHLLQGIEQNAVPITGAGVQTATPFSSIIPVNFILAGNNIPPELAAQTVLNPAEFGKLTLELQAGDATAFLNGGDRTHTVNSPVVDVTALQIVNINLGGRRPMRYVEQFLMREALSAIATERRFTNPIPTGRPIRYILLRTTNEASNTRQPVDDTLGDIKINISQTNMLRYSDFREYAGRNRDAHQVRDAVNPAGLNALSSRDNPAIGYYMFDFAEDGRLDGTLDATRFPSKGIPIDFLHDVETASARQIDVVLGLLQAAPKG